METNGARKGYARWQKAVLIGCMIVALLGTLGVIGPTRMAYDRMIQIVDITSKLVSNALSYHK